jgi:hypothetical protein
VILTPGTLEGCQEPDDWLRREIECAIELERNVVPILANDFCFDDNAFIYLTGNLHTLPDYNALTLHQDYFDAGLERLRTCFLQQPSQGIITPAKANRTSKKEDIFGINFMMTMNIKWPGPLLFIYSSSLGKTISPVAIALYIEAVNKKPAISRIYGYKCRALLRYDEGGSQNIDLSVNNSLKFAYQPIGNVVEKWRTLHSVRFIDDQVYYVMNNDWTKTKRLDFTQNSFHRLAGITHLKSGESLMGWIFFELEQDLRGQLLEIKEIEFTLTNSAGESQIFQHYPEPRGEEEILSLTSAAEWHVMEGYYDLTKEQYHLLPMVDLQRTLKVGSTKRGGRGNKKGRGRRR